MQDETTVPVTQTGDEGKTPEPSQVIRKEERSPAEIAAYNLQKKAEDAKALGLDPKKILGVEEPQDEIPAWYKQEKAKEAKQTALQLAENVADADTKEKVKELLQTRIVPSGNPEQDFKDALSLASSVKNKQIIDEVSRYTAPRTVATGGNVPPTIEEEFVPTEQEKIFMAPPYNMSKEKVLEARRKEQSK